MIDGGKKKPQEWKDLYNKIFETSAILTLTLQAAQNNDAFWRTVFNYDIIGFERAVKIFAYLAKHGMNDTEKLMRNADTNNELE